MKQVFQENDVVYHNLHGKGRVVRIYAGPSCLVHFVDLGYDVNCHPNALSFTPWPAPNHERPLKDGRYIWKVPGTDDRVVTRRNQIWFINQEGVAKVPVYINTEHYQLEYIGE